MTQGDFTWIAPLVAALLAGGGLGALIGWRKPQAEADKIKAETDELVWGHVWQLLKIKFNTKETDMFYSFKPFSPGPLSIVSPRPPASKPRPNIVSPPLPSSKPKPKPKAA
jgi:hypothetical protein